MISKNQLVTITESSILKLIHAFQQNSWLFYTESDLHCYLYNQIFNNLPLEQWGCETSSGPKSCLIHKEYPTKERYSRKLLQEGLKKGSRGHFDLTIWNPEITKQRFFRAANQNFEKEQQTFIVLELDFKENNANIDAAFHHFQWDLMKLKSPKNEVENGYLLVFSRNWINKKDFLIRALQCTSKEEKVVAIYIDNSKENNLVALSKKTIRQFKQSGWNQ
jgi:hypothetical protein